MQRNYVKGIGLIKENNEEYQVTHLCDIQDPKSEVSQRIIKDHNCFDYCGRDEISKIIKKQIEVAFFESLNKVITKEEATILEQNGFVLLGYNEQNPYGTHCIDSFKSEIEDFFKTQKTQTYDFYKIFKLETENFAVISKPQTTLTAEEIDASAFRNITTQTQVISICKKDNFDTWNWSKPEIVPDGMHLAPSLTSTDQYAQTCFEGMIAMVNENLEIVIFRPYDNARRLLTSCQAICIPGVSESDYIQAIKMAVLSNSNFLPSPGSNSKMYIRPSVKAITGGTGVGPASEYAFSVQVFPFSDYFNKSLDLVSIEGTKREVFHKLGANYVKVFLTKVQATRGELDQYPEQKFNDVFFFSQVLVNGEMREALNEDSAGNLFFIEETNNKVTLVTPSLTRRSILPGFTRDSIIKIAKHFDIETREEEHIGWDDIKKMSGAFVSGSAAGMVKIGSMTFRGTKIDFFKEEEENETLINDTFSTLYNSIYELRRGNTENFTTNQEISNFPLIIGTKQ